jgi:hypothetical protein
MQRLVGYLFGVLEPPRRSRHSIRRSMARIVQRYAPTPKQRKWPLDIFHRLERFRSNRIGRELENG